MLWLTDENGGFEILRPGGGFNGRTREPGEPDWWVVAKDPAWTPDSMAQSAPKAQTPPVEPWTLLSAGQEHLDHLEGKGFGEAVGAITQGLGEAVSKGAEGAGEALGKTWDALTTNEELHKGVEFGGKAAWEVTKDVAERAGEDAAGALVSAGSYYKLGESVGKIARGTVFDLLKGGGQDYLEWPGKARDIGERIYKVKERVYGKP